MKQQTHKKPAYHPRNPSQSHAFESTTIGLLVAIIAVTTLLLFALVGVASS